MSNSTETLVRSREAGHALTLPILQVALISETKSEPAPVFDKMMLKRTWARKWGSR